MNPLLVKTLRVAALYNSLIKPMKVLIIKLSSIGDVVHTLPALYALRRGFLKKGIKARIDWLVEEAASGIIKGHPLIDRVIAVKRGWIRNFKENRDVARELASEGYDIVIDFQGLMKSGVWVLLSKGKRRVGFSNSRELSHMFLNEKLPPYDPERHAVDRYLDLARHIGAVTDEVVFPLNIEGARESVAQKLKDNGGEGGPFFVLVTRARWDTKLWSDEKFIELAKRINGGACLNAVLVGGSSDRPGLEEMKARIGDKAINLSGMTDLKELAALMRLSDFVVTVDSGPMHIATAAGAKIIALFGPTAPWRTGPYGGGHIVVRKGLGCSPCFRKRCSTIECMKDITVEDVMGAVAGFMDKAG